MRFFPRLSLHGCVGAALAAAVLLAPAEGLAWEKPGRAPTAASAQTPIWYSFAENTVSRTDGATALYESSRRQTRPRPARSAHAAAARDE